MSDVAHAVPRRGGRRHERRERHAEGETQALAAPSGRVGQRVRGYSTPQKEHARDEEREQVPPAGGRMPKMYCSRDLVPFAQRREQSLIQAGFLFIEERSGRAGE